MLVLCKFVQSLPLGLDRVLTVMVMVQQILCTVREKSVSMRPTDGIEYVWRVMSSECMLSVSKYYHGVDHIPSAWLSKHIQVGLQVCSTFSSLVFDVHA